MVARANAGFTSSFSNQQTDARRNCQDRHEDAECAERDVGDSNQTHEDQVAGEEDKAAILLFHSE